MSADAVTCPKCGKRYKAEWHQRGQWTKCSKCGERFIVDWSADPNDEDFDFQTDTPDVSFEPEDNPLQLESNRQIHLSETSERQAGYRRDRLATGVLRSSLPLWISTAALLVLVVLVGLGGPRILSLLEDVQPRWEYRTIDLLAETPVYALLRNEKSLAYKTIPDPQGVLAELGDDGWELVAVYLEQETAHPNFGKEDYVTGLQPNVRPQKLVCILKRRKP